MNVSQPIDDTAYAPSVRYRIGREPNSSLCELMVGNLSTIERSLMQEWIETLLQRCGSSVSVFGEGQNLGMIALFDEDETD